MSQFRLGAGNGEGQLTTENNHATCRLFPLFRLLGAPKQEKSQPENSPSRSSGAPKQRSCVTTARGLHAGAEASLQDAAAARATRSLFWQNCSLQLRKAQQTHTQPPSAGPRATASACRPAFPLPQSSAERRIAVGTDPLGVTVTASHSSHRSWTRLPAPRRERWGVPRSLCRPALPAEAAGRAPGVQYSYRTVSSERLWSASLRRWTVSCPPVRYLPQPWLVFRAGAVLGWLASHSLRGRTTASAWCRVRQAPRGSCGTVQRGHGTCPTGFFSARGCFCQWNGTAGPMGPTERATRA